ECPVSTARASGVDSTTSFTFAAGGRRETIAIRVMDGSADLRYTAARLRRSLRTAPQTPTEIPHVQTRVHQGTDAQPADRRRLRGAELPARPDPCGQAVPKMSAVRQDRAHAGQDVERHGRAFQEAADRRL